MFRAQGSGILESHPPNGPDPVEFSRAWSGGAGGLAKISRGNSTFLMDSALCRHIG